MGCPIPSGRISTKLRRLTTSESSTRKKTSINSSSRQIGLQDIEAVVDQLLLAHLPVPGEPVLLTGYLAAELAKAIGEKQTLANYDIKAPDNIFNQPPPPKKYSLALVVHRFGMADNDDKLVIGKRLLSRVRDMFAERVLHLVVSDSVASSFTGQSNWFLADSLAMGFVKLSEIRLESRHVAVYDFDIRCYKSEPDWLNAKHWAHPERWNRNQ